MLSTSLIALASAARGWPFATLTAAPWFYQLNTTSNLFRYALLVVFFAGVAGLCWSWVSLLTHVRKKNGASMRPLIAIAIVWSLPLCIAVPLFSGDVFVYYVDGEALARGFSPYESGVSAMGPAPVVHMVHELWRTTTTMYGPIFMWLAQRVAEVSGGSITVAILIFRAIAIASVVVAAVAVTSLAGYFGRRVDEAFVFAILNPLTLLHLVNGAHNDSTMIALLLAGLALGVRANSWPLRAMAISLCVTGAMFKIPAFAGVLVLGWIWCRHGSPIAKRMLAAAIAGAAGLVIFQLLTTLTGLGWGWIRSADVPGLAHPLLAPANAVAMSFGGLVGKGEALNSVTRVIASAASVAIAAWLVLRTGRYGTNQQLVRATGFALLAVAWLGPALYPWYLTWGVMVVAAAGAGRLDRPLIISIVVTSFLVSPGGHGFLDLWSDWRRTVVAFAVTAVFAIILWHLLLRNVVSESRREGKRRAWNHYFGTSSLV